MGKTKKITEIEKDVANYEKTQAEAIYKLTNDSVEIFENLGKKAKKISADEKYTKNDHFALKVADLIIKNIQKQQEVAIKQRVAQKQEVTMFSQMLKDANAGQLTVEDLDKIKGYIND